MVKYVGFTEGEETVKIIHQSLEDIKKEYQRMSQTLTAPITISENESILAFAIKGAERQYNKGYLNRIFTELRNEN